MKTLNLHVQSNLLRRNLQQTRVVGRNALQVLKVVDCLPHISKQEVKRSIFSLVMNWCVDYFVKSCMLAVYLHVLNLLICASNFAFYNEQNFIVH